MNKRRFLHGWVWYWWLRFHKQYNFCFARWVLAWRFAGKSGGSAFWG